MASHQSLRLLKSALHVAVLGVVLILLRWLEQGVPSLGSWLFIALSLSMGMGHGALDAVLLLAQFKPYRTVGAYALVYLLLVVASAALLAQSPGGSLLALLAMSVWHFGELYHPSMVNRLVVGGASVMAPMLLSDTALAAVLQPALGTHYPVAWTVWYWSAQIWAVGTVAWVLGACWQHLGRGGARFVAFAERGDDAARAAIELAAVLALNAVLSPLMAFALYFGLWHSGNHILHVLRALAMHSSRAKMSLERLALALALTGVTTVGLLWLLWRWLLVRYGVSGLSTLAHADSQTFWVQWMIVALAAVTLPHMLLVAYSHRWLGR